MEPITTELRKLMTHTVDGFDLRRPLVECDRETFERLCDNIDAVHEGLERESESLRRELDRLLGELDDMHKTEGLSNNSSSFMQNAEHHAWAPESHYMMLPKDANGEYIHIGDVMEWCDSGETLTVEGIGIDVLFYIDGENAEWTAARNKRHHKPDTWEQIIEDALDGYHDTDFDALVARCKALAGDAE